MHRKKSQQINIFFMKNWSVTLISFYLQNITQIYID
jgi:hypothetical protein